MVYVYYKFSSRHRDRVTVFLCQGCEHSFLCSLKVDDVMPAEVDESQSLVQPLVVFDLETLDIVR